MVYVIVAMGTLFMILGLILTEKNSRILLSGYNTLSPEEQSKIDIGPLVRYFRRFHRPKKRPMKHLIHLTASIALLTICLGVLAQDQSTLAEKLGYAPDAKLLVIHADDIGLAQSVNQASVMAYENGGISSGSLMVPCPWTNDFARYYKENPQVDVGIHITLTAEWDYYKWGGVLPATEIPSLLDENGYFYASVEEVAQHARPEEVEKEIRAQIDRAISLGITPSHLDTHMGSVLATPELVQIYLKLGMEYQLPVFVPRLMLMGVPGEMRQLVEEKFVLVDGFFMLNESKPGISWLDAYGEMVDKMGPGLNQLIVHVAIDNTEMQKVAINHPDFGSAWRQNDLDLLSSKEFREILKKNDIHLVGWKEIKEL